MIEVISTLPQELAKEFLLDKLKDPDNYSPIVEGVKSAADNIIRNIPVDEEGNYYKKQFFLGNIFFSIRIHKRRDY